MTSGPLPSNGEIADRFELLADLLEIGGEQSRHRLLAYRRGAARVRATAGSIAELAVAGRAVELPDIGTTLQDKIVELVETGQIGALTRLEARVPAGLAGIARLQGIGPKRARAIWEELGVTDLAGLADAAAAGRLAAVAGIGPKLVAQVGEQLAAIAEGTVIGERFPLGRALPVAEALVAAMGTAPGVTAIEVAGGLRRGAETVHDIDIAVATDDAAAFVARLTGLSEVTDLISSGSAGAAVMTQAGIRAEFRFTAPETFGNLLQHLTGSKAHNVRLRELAVRRGLSVSEHGVAAADGVRTHADEASLYAELGLQLIPPELREDSGEIPVAADGLIPELVSVGDIRGDLHVHTTWSDGRDTLDEMVAAAAALGLEYLAVSDHSKSLAMARGLDEERVLRQWEAIDRINASDPGVRVLKACEVDVLADGSLDYPDELLAGFDWVTASLHSGFRRSEATLTARVLAAIEHPQVNAIGHPTGRMFGKRDGYPLDFAKVFARAAATGTALEINSQPRRLDLNSDLARRALAAGVALVIGTDAHSVAEFDVRRYGVMTARRAGATPDRVLNTLPLDRLIAVREAKREGAQRGAPPPR